MKLTPLSFAMVPILALAGCAAQGAQDAQDAPAETPITGDKVTSILNAGVTAELGEEDQSVKFLFDPLYDDHFGSLEELGEPLIEAIIAGKAPYDDVDAVFVSHAHGDHFSVSQITRLLAAQADVTLVAPEQAVAQMREGDGWDAGYEARVVGIEIENGEAATSFEVAGATIEAIRSPHSGWPDRHSHVHNLSFRVSARNGARVMHFGDADPGVQHFEPHAEFFASARTGLAIVPFWYLNTNNPDELIDETLNAQGVVGMHVPVDEPDFLEGSGYDYFNELGQEVAVPQTP